MVPCDTAMYEDGMLSSTLPFCDASDQMAVNKEPCHVARAVPSNVGHACKSDVTSCASASQPTTKEVGERRNEQVARSNEQREQGTMTEKG